MDKELFFKVSFVVVGSKHPGAIFTLERRPEVGEEICFNGAVYVITEVMELMPPADNFGFLHATCEFVRPLERPV